jgi:hypothetical protein
MRKKFFTLALLIALVGILSAGTVNYITAPNKLVNSLKQNREEQVVYNQDFENGLGDWTTIDGTVSPVEWRSFEVGGDHGNVWWMGDEALASGDNIGGYLSHEYLVLDTPSINVTAGNSTLTFDLNYAVESVGGTGQYDGWDGCNIRISTDEGATWTVLTGTPAYNFTSGYGFGFEHGEGVGVPGWGGSSSGWVNASFDLSAYEGQDVKIRFAFASDPAYDTTDDATLFGMMVDNISLGDFTNDGSADDSFTASSLVPVGGDLWHVIETNDASSGTKVAICQNDNGTYNINMLDYIVSPTITLPASGDMRADFMLKGTFSDPDTFPNVDYWGWEVSPDNGTTWNAMSNPSGDPNGSNYVFSDVPADWASACESYNGLEGILPSDWAGQDVKFRIYFKSDDDTPDGTGIMIDDFKIYSTLDLPIPANLTAEVNDHNVQLNWQAPVSGDTQSLAYYDSQALVAFVSDGQPYACRITNSTDQEVYLSGINFALYKSGASSGDMVDGTVDVYAWANNNGVPGDLLYTKSGVDNIPHGQFKDVDVMDSGITIPANGEIFVGIGNFTGGTQGLLADSSSVIDEGRYMAYVQDSWSTVNEAYQTLHNLLIGAEILVPNGESNINGYKVYRSTESGSNYSEIATITGNTTNYLDESPASDAMNYYVVTSLTDAGESVYSNEASAYVVSETVVDLGYDDGVSDASYQPSASTLMAVKFSPYINPNVGHIQLQKIKFYLNQTGGNFFAFVWDDNGNNGTPGDELASFLINANEITTGWNIIDIPESVQEQVNFTDGSFYIGFRSGANAPQFGVDTDNSGQSYTGGQDWVGFTQYAEGNFMIHAIYDSFTDNEDVTVPTETISLKNYPNPFNPQTNIYFSLPKAQNVTLKVYNTKGQLVKTLINNELRNGKNNIVWKGLNNSNKPVASGVYFYRLQTAGKSISNKMLLLK